VEYRFFGNTGFKVSVFTLGAMRFLHGWDEPHDQLADDSLENCHQVITTALAAGINLIETARGYGKSERLIGRTLPRLSVAPGNYAIMSKAPPAESAGEMRTWLDESLQRLGVSRLELFALHGINTLELLEKSLRKGGALAGLEQARKEGLIGAIGFSTHAPLPVLLEAIASRAFDFVNLHYYMFRTANRAALDLAAALGMGLLIISPNQKGGLLYEPPQRLQQLTTPLHPVNYNERWLLSHPQVHTMSIGMSEPGHWKLHAESLRHRPYLQETERRIAIRLLSAALASPLALCGDCTRCLPCPEQIDIPEMMRLTHLDRSYDMTPFAQFRYDLMKPGDHWVPGAKGNLCNRCGDCLPRCPQNLQIPDLLFAAHGRFDTEKQSM